MDLSLAPTTKEYLIYIDKLIFRPVSIGQSTIVDCFREAGTYSMFRYLLDIRPEYAKYVNKVKLEVRFTDNLEILYQNLESDQADNIQALYIVPYAEKLLEQIDRSNKTRSYNSIGQVVLLTQEQLIQEQMEKLSFYFRTKKNVVARLREDADIQVLLEKEEAWYKYQINSENKQKIIELSNGYSDLARALLLFANEQPEQFLDLSLEELIEVPYIATSLSHLFGYFLEEEQDLLLAQLLPKEIHKKYAAPELAVSLNLVSLEDNLQVVFRSSLFRAYLEKVVLPKYALTENERTLLRLGKDISNLLSAQETQIVRLLWENQNKIVSKDQIAQVIWGGSWRDKYSDWTIDTLLFNVRKKLNMKNQIISIKRKGVKIVVES